MCSAACSDRDSSRGRARRRTPVLVSPATRGAAYRSNMTRRYVPKLQTGPLAVFPAIVFDTIFQKYGLARLDGHRQLLGGTGRNSNVLGRYSAGVDDVLR